MPAVVVTGEQQTGKSTLAEHLAPGRRRYSTLDDFDVRDAARRNPEALVGGNATSSGAIRRAVLCIARTVALDACRNLSAIRKTMRSARRLYRALKFG